MEHCEHGRKRALQEHELSDAMATLDLSTVDARVEELAETLGCFWAARLASWDALTWV